MRLPYVDVNRAGVPGRVPALRTLARACSLSPVSRNLARIATVAMALAIAFPAAPVTAISNAPAPSTSSRTDAEFRYRARELYLALNMESCPARPMPRRALLLATERQVTHALEARMAAAPAGFHLAAARGDALYEIAADSRCWEDSDPGFAAMHVRMAREAAQAGLGRIAVLAPQVAGAPPPGEDAAAPGRAAFRYLVRRLAGALAPPCAMSGKAGDDEILAPARAELSRFRARLEGTSHAIDYDLAKADANYLGSITVAECVEPSTRAPAALSREALAGVRRQIARLEAGMRGGRPTGGP